MNKIKILYIHHGKGLGGAPLSLLYLIQNLDKEKYHPVVLFLHDSDAMQLYKSKGIEVFGPANIEDFPHTKIRWYRIYHLHLLLKSYFDYFCTTFFYAKYWFDKIQPDIVHLNTSSLVAWAKVACKKNIPVIFHIREPLARGYLGLRKKFVTKMVGKYSNFILPICNHDARPWIQNPKTKIIYNAVDALVFDRKINGKDFFKLYNYRSYGSTGSPRTDMFSFKPGVPENLLGLNLSEHDFVNKLTHIKTVDIGNTAVRGSPEHSRGIEPYERECEYELNNSPKILFLGGLSREKGTLEILEIFQNLLKILPEARLLIAGYFDLNLKSNWNLKRYAPAQRYVAKVKKVLEEIKESVLFLGPIENVPRVMAASDVVVFPATVGHFARPIIEAGFMAKPVVTSNIAPLNELVIFSKTGFLVDLNRQDLWVEKLHTLLTNKSLNEQMGKNAFEFCMKNFDVKNQVLQVEQIYSKALSK